MKDIWVQNPSSMGPRAENHWIQAAWIPKREVQHIADDLARATSAGHVTNRWPPASQWMDPNRPADIVIKEQFEKLKKEATQMSTIVNTLQERLSVSMRIFAAGEALAESRGEETGSPCIGIMQSMKDKTEMMMQVIAAMAETVEEGCLFGRGERLRRAAENVEEERHDHMRRRTV